MIIIAVKVNLHTHTHSEGGILFQLWTEDRLNSQIVSIQIAKTKN